MHVTAKASGRRGRFVVAIASSHMASGRNVMRGVSATALRLGWHFEMIDAALTWMDLTQYRPVFERAEGAIVRGAAFVEKAVPMLPPGVPLVAVDADAEIAGNAASAPWGCVMGDQRRIGEAAAEELLATGRQCFAFVPMLRHFTWTKPRGDAFAAAVRAAGREARLYHPRTDWDWIAERRAMAQWLFSMPRPFGLFAGNDILAKFALDACREAGLRVPYDVAIVGADDDETLCLSTSPTLSSVRIDFEGAGRMAAERLDALMGRPRPRRRALWRYGVVGVARRGSTLPSDPGVDSRVAAGLDFISLHYADPFIGVQDVAAAMGTGRRKAERLFAATGRTIRGHIEDRRLEEVRAMLRGTDAAVKEIASRCGFSSDIYLSLLFRRRFGLSPGAWRRRNPAASTP